MKVMINKMCHLLDYHLFHIEYGEPESKIIADDLVFIPAADYSEQTSTFFIELRI